MPTNRMVDAATAVLHATPGDIEGAIDAANRVAMNDAVEATGPLPSARVPIGLVEVERVDLERLLGIESR